MQRVLYDFTILINGFQEKYRRRHANFTAADASEWIYDVLLLASELNTAVIWQILDITEHDYNVHVIRQTQVLFELDYMSAVRVAQRHQLKTSTW